VTAPTLRFPEPGEILEPPRRLAFVEIPMPAPRPRYGPHDVLTKAELAAFFGKCERTVERMNFPAVVVGREPFYVWATVVEYLRKQSL
jgi:hypothetical protein